MPKHTFSKSAVMSELSLDKHTTKKCQNDYCVIILL